MVLFLVLKVLIAVILVLLLVYISEKVSPRIAGIIGGTAIGGTSVSLFFFGLEQGTEFVQQAIPWTVAALGAEIIFYFGYFLGSKILPERATRGFHILGSIILGFTFFLGTGYTLSLIDISLPLAVLIFICLAFFVNLGLNQIKEKKIENVKIAGMKEILFRIIIVAILIIAITSVPQYLGNRWAGIFSSFATTTFPVLLILHYKYGNRAFPTVIKTISWSISSLLIYVISIFYFYPMLDVYLGTIAGFFTSFAYLFLITSYVKFYKNVSR